MTHPALRLLIALAADGGPLRSPWPLERVGRHHLPEFCRSLGFKHGAEIGVWKGDYSALCCKTAPAMHMLCVDPWASYPEWKDGKHHPDEAQRFMDEAHAEAVAKLKGLNATICRKFSADAAADVPDASLDFVYIDGNHSYAAATQDLELWVPKVKRGGIAAGHDCKVFPLKPYIKVLQAVTDYTEAHGISPWFTTAADKTPSFLWIAQ